MLLQLGEGLEIDINRIAGKSVAVLGKTGSGKSNTTTALAEEMLSAGFPLAIVDIEGEYYGLKEKYEILVAGKGKMVEVPVAPAQAGQLAQLSLQKSLSIILDVSKFKTDERNEFLLNYFEALWETAQEEKRPYQVFLEEAHIYIPQIQNQNYDKVLKDLLITVAVHGRKHGLGLVILSQRSATVDKTVLTQAYFMFLHRVSHPTDLRVYQDLIPLPDKQVDSMVKSLADGQAIVLENAEIIEPSPAQIRRRYTFDTAATPQFGTEQSGPAIKSVDASLLAELQKMFAKTESVSNSTAKSELNLRQLRERISELEQENATLKEQIELLSKLKVELTATAQPSTPVSVPPSNARLEIERMEVGQLVTKSNIVVPEPPINPAQTIKPVPKSKTATPPVGAPSRSVPLAPPPQAQEIPLPALNRLDRLVKNKGLERMLPAGKAIFAALLEKGEEMSYSGLAAYTGYAINTVSDRRMTAALTKAGLVEYTGTGIKPVVTQFCQLNYHGVDPKVIMKWLKERLKLP